MTALAPNKLMVAWNHLQTFVPLTVIRTPDQYDQALVSLDSLLQEVGDDEAHPLAEVVDTLGTLIHAYEEAQFPMGQVSGLEVLQYLMEEHALTMNDVPEIGSAAQVQAILTHQHTLTLPMIYALARRFGLPPATFV